MGLFDRISTALRNADTRPITGLHRPSPSLRSIDPNRLPEFLSSRAPDWTAWDDPAILADALQKVTIVFACATYLADACAEAPLEIYREIDGERDVADDRVADAARTLFRYPNPYQSGAEFQHLAVLDMAICGYAMVEMVRAGSGLPVQLWLLRPDWMVRRQTTTGERIWEYRPSFKDKRTIPYDDVVIVPYYQDTRRERYGVSPAQVAAREIGVDSGLTDFLKTFLDSGGIPPFVLTHPDPIHDPAIVTTMQEQWRQKYGGSRAYGSLPVLHGGYKIEEIGGSIDEMAWPDLRGLTELKVAQAYRVPLELLQGYLTFKGGSSLTSSEMDGAMTVLQRYGASPLRGRIAASLARGVLTEFTGGDRSYELEHDTDDVLALQEDEDKKQTRVRANWNDGLLTLDQALIAIGEQPLPGKAGNVRKLRFTDVLVPGDTPMESEPAPAVTSGTTAPKSLVGRVTIKELRYRDVKALSAGELQVRSGALDRARKDRQRLTEIGSRQLRKFWKEQADRIIAGIGKAAGGPKTRDIAAVDWPDEEQRLRTVLGQFYDATGKAAFDAASDLLGIEIDWTLANPNVQRVMHDLGGRIVAISAQTQTDVAQVVSDALGEGVTLQELSDRLKGLFTETYKGRAMTVARTESAHAYNRASVVGYAESGEVKEVELSDNSAHDTDPFPPTNTTCADRDTLLVPLEQTNSYIDSMHPNCIMAVIPVLATALGEE